MRDRKKFLNYSTNEWISLHSDVKQLFKLNTTQKEKGNIFQKYFKLKKMKKDDKSIVRKSCIDVASSSNMNMVEDYY